MFSAALAALVRIEEVVTMWTALQKGQLVTMEQPMQPIAGNSARRHEQIADSSTPAAD